MRDRFHINNAAVFAVMWVALSALALHDISLRQHGGGGGTTVSDRVVTKEFILKDDNGVTRARIGMSDKTNAPSVQLFDANGAQRAQLRLNQADVPSLRLYNGEGKLKSVVGFVSNDSQPTFATFDANGVGHVENRSRPDAAYINVQDEDLSSGRYVQSYHGTVDLYAGQTVTTQTAVPQLRYTYQVQSSAEVIRQAELAGRQVELAARRAQQEEELARQQAEMVRERAVSDAIKAAADRVDIQASQIQR